MCLLRALSGYDDVELVLFSREGPFSRHLEGIRAKIVTFEARRESLWNDWLLPRMIEREGVEVFHAPADRGLPIRKPCPMVVTVHASYERAHWRSLFPTAKRKVWYWKHEIANYWLADAVLTVSESTRNELIGMRAAPKHKLHRIYLGPSAEFHDRTCDSDGRVLKNHGIPRRFVLYVGGYDPWKNVSSLVQAFDRANLPEHALVIVAQKVREYTRLVQGWAKYECFPRLRLVEAEPEEIPAFYRGAELFVNPSLWESFSFQLVEAMACGTPILASNRKAIPEIAGDAALFFDPEDVEELARLMEDTVGDSALRHELRKKGLERVKAFSWKHTAEQTVRIYYAVVGRSAG